MAGSVENPSHRAKISQKCAFLLFLLYFLDRSPHVLVSPAMFLSRFARTASALVRQGPASMGKRWSSASAAAELNQHLQAQMDEMKDAGTFKVERVITSPQSANITVQERPDAVINLCANNYLGLSNDPELVQVAKDTLDSHGFGLSSVRFICGTQDIHKQLEALIAEFHGTEDAILYPSCFDANAAIFEAILTPDDAIVTDALNHASIIDGIRLCKAQKYIYNHLDLEDMRSKLETAKAKGSRFRWIVTDGAFSMDGDIAPLDQIKELADEFDAQIFIDECHATGFIGPRGRGTDEHFGVKVDVINSTLGKALGGATGGYTAGSKELVGMLRQKGRPYLFSNSIAPSVVGASIRVFERLLESSELVEKVRHCLIGCDWQTNSLCLATGATCATCATCAAAFTR